MTDAVNISRMWADLLVEELIRAGVGLFCLAPGSRSTPLTTAVAANPRADHVMHFDERGTAFCALGYGRATRRPAAWITTSGTAVANGMPAVVEASVDNVPMLLLTADRPPELRATGANQTIDQVKIFGDYVRWQFDLPAPDASVDPAMVLTTADQAVYRARRTPSGPVHLNTMFREPLAPDPDGGHYDDYLSGLSSWMEGRRPYTRYGSAISSPSDLGALWARLRQVDRGLIAVGRLDTCAQADAVRWLSDRLRWPLLPDVCSQLRLGGEAPPDVTCYHYDLALSSESFRQRARPDAVLYFGSRATSKRLNRFLAESRPELFAVVRESPERMDPHHRVTDHIEADVVTFCDELADLVDREGGASDAWAGIWTNASAAVERTIETELDDAVSEPAVARAIAKKVPDGSGLLLASSMPVRDLDMYGAAAERAPFVTANRGASGIDGLVATSVGMARGLRRPVTLLIGDLALLHDLNSLALLQSAGQPVIIIVVNNHGGGIFSFLPIARHPDMFEPYFGTPHHYAFDGASRMFGIEYAAARTIGELTEVYQSALADGRPQLIEVTTDREENVHLHRRLETLIAEAVNA